MNRMIATRFNPSRVCSVSLSRNSLRSQSSASTYRHSLPKPVTSRASLQFPAPIQKVHNRVRQFAVDKISSVRTGVNQRSKLTTRPSASNGGNGGGGTGGGDGGGGGGGDGSGGDKEPTSIWGAYMKAMDANPLLVKSITTAILNVGGDILSQLVIEKDGFNLKRAVIFFIIGLGLVGPVLHVWYSTLGGLVTATGTVGTLQRLFLDQAFFAPSFVALFFTTLLTLEGHPQDVPAKLRQDWWPAVQTNWKIWIPFQFLNFRFIPPKFHVAGANVIALVWNTYLSWAGHKALEP